MFNRVKNLARYFTLNLLLSPIKFIKQPQIPLNPMTDSFKCRKNCGACCIAPSISSTIPSMPNGKPAGIACFHLDENFQCKLFGQATRPKVCSHLKPCFEMCGTNRNEAFNYLTQLEQLTSN